MKQERMSPLRHRMIALGILLRNARPTVEDMRIKGQSDGGRGDDQQDQLPTRLSVKRRIMADP
jgi:hypothetical protein